MIISMYKKFTFSFVTKLTSLAGSVRQSRGIGAFLFLLLFASCSRQERVLVKEPYSMAPTASSVRIVWQTADTVSLGTVRYGTSPRLGSSLSGRGGWLVEGEGYVHVVELTGLEPFTTYYFSADGSSVCSTRTAPLAGTPCRLFTLSDTHLNSCHNWENMQDSICALQPDLAVFIGDFLNEGNTRPWDSIFFRPGRPFLSRTPIMSALGNHETGDPTTYRWSTFFDYFSQFSHGYSEDSVQDPRGEAYFSFPYGDALIVCVCLNGDSSSVGFLPGSRQYDWLDRTLAEATAPWILVFGHVGIYTSGYHGQWSDEPKLVAPLLEKHVAEGKRIIYFCGDDHSFEHLLKDGVHYVRPGCGRNSNYAQQTQLIDCRYSLFYRQVSCYSTLDLSADSLLLCARDSAGTPFYRYSFHLAE